METLPKDPILKFKPNTLYEVRKAFDLDKPGAMVDAVNILEEWVKRQDHFLKTDFDKTYLERTIITTKGSIERAKTRLDKVCTLRTLSPDLFQEIDVKNDFKDVFHHVYEFAVLPHLTKDNYRVIIIKSKGNKFKTKMFTDFYKIKVVLTEYLRAHDYATGYIYVLDYTELSIFEYMAKIDLIDFRQTVILLTEGYGVRVKGIHIVTTNGLVETLIALFKKALSAKLGSRIQTHHNFESLFNYVEKEIFPKEYGGEEKSLSDLHDDWMEVLSSKEHTEYQKVMNGARINENLRKSGTFNEQYLGMPGTFRTLSVD